eukprot:maker-scaffold853_size88743-snap-gene-0.13 protein:Tk09858 transcript:maker-scaffold853_size88743-snap-gene-0.13-mRNA-1 annotation:"ubiquitin carboxyl-terminal hydrolase 7"
MGHRALGDDIEGQVEIGHVLQSGFGSVEEEGSEAFEVMDAEKGILFTSFPPVLHLHLMRFQYDPITDSSVKFNDRFEFPNELNLKDYLKKTEDPADDEAMEVDGESPVLPSSSGISTCPKYLLHAVLVHSGDNHGGHYVVFINPKGDGKWCKFDDDVVSRCTEKEAIHNNFGGLDDDVSTRQSTNAYMLVYIRKSTMTEILCDVTEPDIPTALSERLSDEKKIEIAKRREKNEAHLYMTIRLFFEDNFNGHQGNDLYDADRITPLEIRAKKLDTLETVIQQVSTQMKIPKEQLRMWPMNHRTNQTLRPALIDLEADSDKAIFDVADNANIYSVFLELAPPESPGRPLPPFDKDQDVMLFFKYYDPEVEKIHYMGHMYVSITAKVTSMVPELIRRANLAPDTSLNLYEEIKPNMLERIEDIDKPLEHVLEELMDGDIIVYQRQIQASSNHTYRLASCRDYFRDLFYKVEVTFVDKNLPNDSGFTLTLSQRMNYSQIAQAAGEKLDIDPEKVQFFKTQNYREMPGHALRCTFEGTLKDLLVCARPKQPRKLFYQKLAIPIHELENKKQIKCTWLSPDFKEEEELTLYPSKTGTVSDMLEEAKATVTLSRPNAKLRLLDIVSHKINNINPDNSRIETLPTTQSKSYRIEEIPEDQMKVNDNEMLVPVVHFQKEIYSTFGHPFLLKVKEGEKFQSVKDKIQKHLEVPDKEFEKYRIAVISVGRPKYLETLEHDTVRLKDFLNSGQTSNNAKPYFGLEHVNKNSKRARYNYMEKAIKIYN